MISRIDIVRHGRSAYPFPTDWITLPQFREWISIFNRSGISDDSGPPEDLMRLVAGEPVVVCSDYPRSVELAARLCPGRQPRISAMFREVGRPLQGSWHLRLPLA